MRPLAAEPGATVLARIGRDVVWTVASNGAVVYRAGAGPSELGEGERLRDRLRPGRFFGFLPLVHFLQVRDGDDAIRAASLLRHRRPQSCMR